MAVTVIRNFIAKALFKQKGAIANNKAVEFSANALEQRLRNFGIDPNLIKNEQELNQILSFVKQSEDQAFNQRFGDMLAGSKFDKPSEVLDMTGKKIDPRSKIMGGKQSETEAEILARINKENKEAVQKIKDRKRLEDRAIEDFVDDAGGVNPDDPRGIDDFIPDDDPEPLAQGGRAGFKKGSDMTRRSFLKILGGLASIPILGKFLKPLKTAKGVSKVPVIMTDNVPGKPEWFDALVNKVILEGDDVTKKFATAERQSIHQKTLDDGSVVRVTEDVDDGAVRVEYESETNVFGDPATMQYKKPLPDEGAPRPAADFTTSESGPVSRQVGPEDAELEIDEVGGSSIRDLDSDVSKLKEYATGKKPTMKEVVQNIERRKKAQNITEDPEAQMDAVIRRQGDYDPSGDEFASGGIARMLGE